MIDEHGKTVIIPTRSFGFALLERYTSRGFVMSAGLEIVGCYGFLHNLMDAKIFLAFSSLIAGLYSAHSIVDKNINGAV